MNEERDGGAGEARKVTVQWRAQAERVYREDEERRAAQERAVRDRIDALERLVFLVQFAPGSEELERLRREYPQHIVATRQAAALRNPVVPFARILLQELERVRGVVPGDALA